MKRRGILPVDLVVLGYLALLTGATLSQGPGTAYAGWLLLSTTLIALLIGILTTAPLGAVGRLLGEVYPILLLLAFYGAVDLVHVGGGAVLRDATVQRWEAAVFGGQISRTWWHGHPSGAWSAVFHAAYLSYYVVVPAPPLYFLVRRRWDALRRSVALIATAFVACYACYLVFPVAGPYYEFARPEGPLVSTLPARWAYAILAGGSSYGAAFPSSHVAATVAAVAASWSGARPLALVLVVPTGLLAVGVVYIQMHYAVDVLAGVAVAAVVIGAERWVERRRPTGASGAGGA